MKLHFKNKTATNESVEIKEVDDSFDFSKMKKGEKVKYDDLTITCTGTKVESVGKVGIKSIYSLGSAEMVIYDSQKEGGSWYEEAIENNYFEAKDIQYIDYSKDKTDQTFYIKSLNEKQIESGIYQYVGGRLYTVSDEEYRELKRNYRDQS